MKISDTKHLALAFLSFFNVLLILNGQELPKLRIDPSRAYGGSVSEYFDNVEFIPLETTKESLFGDISGMIITDSSIVVTDTDTRSLLFFAKDGRFLTKLKGRENEFPNISLDAVNKRIVILLYNSIRKESVYKSISYTGQNVMNLSIDSRKQSVLPVVDQFYASTNSCFYSVNEKPRDSTYYLLDIFNGSKRYKSFFPVNQQNSSGFCALAGELRLPNVSESGAFYVSLPFGHEIYRVTKDTAVGLFQIVLPAKQEYPKDVKTVKDQIIIDSMRTVANRDWKRIVDISNIFFNKSRMFFKLNPKLFVWFSGSEQPNQYNFIFDTLKQKLVSLERISPDSSSYFLPTLDRSSRNITRNGLFFENGYFYSNVSSLKMFEAMERTKSKAPKYPPILLEYFMAQNRKSNPVIVKMKLKE